MKKARLLETSVPFLLTPNDCTTREFENRRHEFGHVDDFAIAAASRAIVRCWLVAAEWRSAGTDRSRSSAISTRHPVASYLTASGEWVWPADWREMRNWCDSKRV